MKIGLTQKLMWNAFQGSFAKAAASRLGVENPTPLMESAKQKYYEILADIDEFKRGDRFIYNILSCAMLCSVLLASEQKYTVEQVTVFYRTAMITNRFVKSAAKRSKVYTEQGRAKLKNQAAQSLKNTNPYSWVFTVSDGDNINKYTATFYSCGICHLMKKLDLFEYVPAMCSLDYDLAAINNTVFTRDHTIAEGANNCDCHYNHRK